MSSTEERSDVSRAGPCRKLHEYSSREVAEELCLIDSELLRKIDTNELRNGAWMKKEKVSLCLTLTGGFERGREKREEGEGKREREEGGKESREETFSFNIQ